MPGTFSQIYIQIVFAVQGRQNFVQPSFEEDLYKYISGIISAKEQKSLAVNGMPDHVHVLVGLKPAMRISDLVRDIKNNSTNFINDHNWLRNKFSWQEGYGAFRIPNLNLERSLIISKIKNNIIRSKHSGRSIYLF